MASIKLSSALAQFKLKTAGLSEDQVKRVCDAADSVSVSCDMEYIANILAGCLLLGGSLVECEDPSIKFDFDLMGEDSRSVRDYAVSVMADALGVDEFKEPEGEDPQ